MKKLPETDIVALAQEIIDNFAASGLKKAGRPYFNALAAALWIAAGFMTALTLSLYFLLK